MRSNRSVNILPSQILGIDGVISDQKLNQSQSYRNIAPSQERVAADVILRSALPSNSFEEITPRRQQLPTNQYQEVISIRDRPPISGTNFTSEGFRNSHQTQRSKTPVVLPQGYYPGIEQPTRIVQHRSVTPTKIYSTYQDYPGSRAPQNLELRENLTHQISGLMRSKNQHNEASVVIEHPDIPIPMDITIPIRYSASPAPNQRVPQFDQGQVTMAPPVRLTTKTKINHLEQRSSVDIPRSISHDILINPAKSLNTLHWNQKKEEQQASFEASHYTKPDVAVNKQSSLQQGSLTKSTNFAQTAIAQPASMTHQNIQTSVVLQSKVTTLPVQKITSEKREAFDIPSESMNSFASSRSEAESNRYKKLWIKKIEEIGELKKLISTLKDDTGDKGSELERVKALYNQMQQELHTQQQERMKKSKLVIENKAEGDKYRQLYSDLKDQTKLLQEERTSLIQMLKSKDESKYEELGSVNSLYNEARNEIEKLREQIHVINTENVKLRTALATTEMRFEDLGREFRIHRTNMDQAHEAKMLVKQSELQEVRDSLRLIERERDEWRAKEESLRSDLYFLKEINIKSHEITRTEYEQRLQTLGQEHCKTLEQLSNAHNHEENFTLEIKKQMEDKVRLETEVQILGMANQSLIQRTAFAESDSLKAKEDYPKLNEQLQVLISKSRVLEQEKNSALSQVASLKEEINQIKAERHALKLHLETQTQGIESNRQELDDCHFKVQQLQQENQSLGLENDQLKKNVHFLNLALDELQSQVDEKGNYPELHKSHENLQRDQIALLEEFESLKFEHEALRKKYETLKKDKFETSEMALMNQLEGGKIADEVSVKHSNLLQEYSKIYDEKQELVKVLDEMRQELASHKKIINSILNGRINTENGQNFDLEEVDFSPEEKQSDHQLARKSEKRLFEAIQKSANNYMPDQRILDQDSSAQQEFSQESDEMKVMRFENQRLKQQLEELKSQAHQNQHLHPDPYPHGLDLKDEQSQRLWESYKKNIQEESSKQSPKMLDAPVITVTQPLKKAHTFYLQQGESSIPHDVSPGKSFSQFVDIGNNLPNQNQQNEDSFEIYQREHQQETDQTSYLKPIANEFKTPLGINKSTLPFQNNTAQVDEYNYDLPILNQPQREPSESPYVHQTQNINSQNLGNQVKAKEEIASSMMHYELEPAPRTLIDGSAIDVEMPTDDYDEMKMQYRFQTVVPNIIDTARNTISPNTMQYHISSKEHQGQNDKMQQMMDMIAQLKRENQQLKTQTTDTDLSPKFAFADLGQSSEHRKTPEATSKKNEFYLSNQNDFEMDSMAEDGSADQVNLQQSSLSLTNNEAEKIVQHLSHHFKEIDDYISQRTSKASGSRDSDNIPKLDTRFRQDIAVERKKSQEKGEVEASQKLNQATSNLFFKKPADGSSDVDIKQTCMFGYQTDSDQQYKLSRVESQGNKAVEFNSFDPQEAEKRLSATPELDEDKPNPKPAQVTKTSSKAIRTEKSTGEFQPPPIRNTINPILAKKAPKPEQPKSVPVAKVEDHKITDSFMQIYNTSQLHADSANQPDTSKYTRSQNSLNADLANTSDEEIQKILEENKRLKESLYNRESQLERVESYKDSYENRAKTMENIIEELEKKVETAEKENERLSVKFRQQNSEVLMEKEQYLQQVQDLQEQIDLLKNQEQGDMNSEDSEFLRQRLFQLQAILPGKQYFQRTRELYTEGLVRKLQRLDQKEQRKSRKQDQRTRQPSCKFQEQSHQRDIPKLMPHFS